MSSDDNVWDDDLADAFRPPKSRRIRVTICSGVSSNEMFAVANRQRCGRWWHPTTRAGTKPNALTARAADPSLSYRPSRIGTMQLVPNRPPIVR